jgi:hypothetical protein
MAELTPREQRHERIELLRAVAASLMSEAMDDTLKTDVQRALDELTEAMEHLGEPSFDTRRPRQTIADMAIGNADALLQGVARAVKLADGDSPVPE